MSRNLVSVFADPAVYRPHSGLSFAFARPGRHPRLAHLPPTPCLQTPPPSYPTGLSCITACPGRHPRQAREPPTPCPSNPHFHARPRTSSRFSLSQKGTEHICNVHEASSTKRPHATITFHTILTTSLSRTCSLTAYILYTMPLSNKECMATASSVRLLFVCSDPWHFCFFCFSSNMR